MDVWYINLDRRTDRRNMIEKNFKEMGVPEARVQRISGTDRDAFESPNALVTHAGELGYPEFQKYLIEQRHLIYLGYMVSYFRALDTIRQQTETVLLMEDDYALHETYTEICESFAELPKPVRFAMLAYNINHPDTRTCPPLSETSVWQHGTPANGNIANIYTPEGAAFLLDICRQRLPETCENTIKNLPLDTPHVYSRKREHIRIGRPAAKGDTDVRNKRGEIFARTWIEPKEMVDGSETAL